MNEQYSTLQSQHEYVDNNIRSTNNIDYEKIRIEGKKLLYNRRNNINYENINKNLKGFKNIYESIITCESTRLDEFEEIMDKMLNRLIDVQNGNDNLANVRNDIFEKDLAERYYKK